MVDAWNERALTSKYRLVHGHDVTEDAKENTVGRFRMGSREQTPWLVKWG